MIDNLDTKTKILSAAKEEFGKYGYKSASTNRIYPKANVSKGMIFKLFKSKAFLFYEVFQVSLKDMLEEMAKAELEKEPDFIKKISYIASWKLEYAHKHPLDMKIMLEAFTSPPKEISDLLSTHLNDILKLNIPSYFEELDMKDFRDEYTKADVMKNINIASQGIQNVYLSQLSTIEDYEIVKDEILDFFNILVRGMKKND